VPILGPVDHHEPLYDKDAARLALFSYGAARNFRNIWHHYPEDFDQFSALVRETWPGLDILRPEINYSEPGKPRLNMFCKEDRLPREIFWSGFGFQVWCQMLTHLIKSRNNALFLVDEPDIYLHSELQRQLLNLLKSLGPDIATHSVEMVSEAEADDIVLVSKTRSTSQRLREPAQLVEVFETLGSSTNPTLTQLAKTRRVPFVEGKDFQIFSRFARRLGILGVANRRGFAIVPVGGYNPERVRNLKEGMEQALGQEVSAAMILDRDYRCTEECSASQVEYRKFCEAVYILSRKEIENYILVPSAIDRAIAKRSDDRRKRTGRIECVEAVAEDWLREYSDGRKSYVIAQFLAERKRHFRSIAPGMAEATINEAGIEEFEKAWSSPRDRMALVPGKETLTWLNEKLQERWGVSISPAAIIDAMSAADIPPEIKSIIDALETFAKE